MNRLTLAIVLSVLTPVLSVSGATEGGLTVTTLWPLYLNPVSL